MLQLAGTPLLCPTLDGVDLPSYRDVCAWVEKNLTLRDVVPFVQRAWPGSPARGLASITFPTGLAPLPPVTPGRLCWPGWGCSRWACGHYLAGADAVRAIRDEAFDDDGRGLNPVLLELDSPGSQAAESLEASVYLMPPKPLSGIRGVNGLYLLTVVDERYLWWSVPTRPMPEECVCTWEDVFAYCSVSLDDYGLGPIDSVDPIPAAYGKPHHALLNLRDEPLPLVLDAACANVGMRLIRTPDGAVRVIGPATAQANLMAELGKPLRSLRAGGSCFLDVL